MGQSISLAWLLCFTLPSLASDLQWGLKATLYSKPIQTLKLKPSRSHTF